MNPMCPLCGSLNTLPYEEESEHNFEISLTMIIVSGLLLIGLYLAIIVTSYIFYPLVVFAGIIIASKIVNKNRNVGKKGDIEIKETLFLCLNCNRSFKSSNK